MASWGSCDFSDLQGMAARFRAAADIHASEQFTREVLQELANMLLADTKERTPVDTGHLRRTWFITAVRQRGDVFEVEIYNNTEYAPWVENGHRIVRNGRQVGYCEGFYMLRYSMLDLEREAPGLVGIRAEQFLQRLMEGK